MREPLPYLDLELMDTQEKFVVTITAIINALVERENERTPPLIITDLSTAGRVH